MKIRSIISSTLLAAGLGITGPAQAHDSIYSLWWVVRDGHYPRAHHDGYCCDHHQHAHFKKKLKRHHWRHHDNDRHRHDGGRDRDRHDGYDRHSRH